MKNNTPAQLKQALESCKTFADIDIVVKETHTALVKELIDSLISATRFVELTMRDEAILRAFQVEFKQR